MGTDHEVETLPEEKGDLVIDARRRGLRIVGNAYDISRILEATKRAMDYFEQNGGDLTAAVTIVVHPPQDDEP